MVTKLLTALLETLNPGLTLVLAALILGWITRRAWPRFVHWTEPDVMRIDPQRLNDEECRVRRERLVLDDDPVYREKVKRRMMEGLDRHALAPLYTVVKREAIVAPAQRQATAATPPHLVRVLPRRERSGTDGA